jgi:hypothetical protein
MWPFSRKSTPKPKGEEALIVHFDYGRDDWSEYFEFEEQLRKAIDQAGVGEFDGNELAFDGSDGWIYMYAEDIDSLLGVVWPILSNTTVLKNAMATLRYGRADDPLAKEVQVPLGPNRNKMV